MSESTIIATFAVYAGTTVEFSLDVTGMTDQQIADAVREQADLDTSLCHECCHRVVDPQAEEMTGLQVDDREIDLSAPSSEDTPADTPAPRVWREGNKPLCDRKAGHAGLCQPRCTKTPGCTERQQHRGGCTTGTWGTNWGWAESADDRCPLSEVPAGGGTP